MCQIVDFTGLFGSQFLIFKILFILFASQERTRTLERSFIIEACVDSLEDAIKAEKAGADRIELCSRLDLDGLTPDFALTKSVQGSVNIPLRIMIRPREGDFYYSDDEVVEMIDAISKCRYLNVEGVVLGATTSNRQKLDHELIDELAQVAYPLKVTIHKVIDDCSAPLKEIEKLKSYQNVDSVLTSGQANTAEDGVEMLKSMNEAAGNEITVIGAGKITKSVIPELHAKLNLRAYHGRKITE